MANPDSQLYGGDEPLERSEPPIEVKEEVKDTDLHGTQERDVGDQDDRLMTTRGSFGERNPYGEAGVEESKLPDLEDLDAAVGVQESSRGRRRVERRGFKNKESDKEHRTSRRKSKRRHEASSSEGEDAMMTSRRLKKTDDE